MKNVYVKQDFILLYLSDNWFPDSHSVYVQPLVSAILAF